ncbi:MAG: DUF177 domain-containing protein [Pseudomonadota bacterium]|nr:DUF177 domain-containing protein [Pseudomonadota bacterium]
MAGYDDDAPILPQVLRLDRLPREGASGSIVADQTQLLAIARRLGLIDLSRLVFEYALTPAGPRKWRLKAKLTADVLQQCVVTLKPVPAQIEESVEEEFWPADELEAGEGDAEGVVLSPDGPEPVENARLRLGQFAYETFASALDPYPRAPGAKLDCAAASPAVAPQSPFAKLEKLKKPRSDA